MQQLFRFFSSLFLVSLLFVGIAAMADNSADLATITLPVADQTQPALFKLAPDAMRQVLVKMSGNPNITNNPNVRTALSQANQWIQSFTYTTVSGDNNTSILSVTIHFDQQALNRLLHQVKQPVLTTVAHRPVTLAWINVNQGSNSSLAPLASGDQSNVGKALTAISTQMGLPFILPAMDLEDQGFVNNDTTLPFDLQKLGDAGNRYHIKSILAGNLSMAVDGTWQAQWMYLLNAQSHQWQSTAATPTVLFQKALVHVGDIMSTELTSAPKSGPQATVNFQVLGVNGLNDYALVMNDLKQVTVISRVIISELNGTTISFQLIVQGGQSALESALQHNADFTEIPPGSLTPDQAQQQALYYQFNSSHTANNINSVGPQS